VLRLYSAVLILSFAAVSALAAQGPMPGAPGAPSVEMLLSQTGPLQLSDAQVVRLAAIARRAEDRHRVLRTHLDSLRPRRAPGDRDSTARRPRELPPTDLFEREREASHNDLRDALAVLSPDQQARAWEMIASRRSMPFPRGSMRRDGGGRDGARPQMGPGAPAPQPRRPGESS
jgi:hypothetical protein